MGPRLQVRHRAGRKGRHPDGEPQMSAEPTPSQTIGTFFHDALLDRDRSELVSPDHPDDDREDLPLDENFSGFGRSGTGEGGEFSFSTVKPGPVPGPEGQLQAPHVMVSIFARGLLARLVTRIYFPDEQEANAADPILSSIEDRELRRTLIARDEGDALRFDIHLQGDGQTAFFEF